GDHLGVRVTSGQVDYLLNKLYNDRTQKGLLVHHKIADAQQAVDRCRYKADDFFQSVREFQAYENQPNGRVARPEVVPNELSPANPHHHPSMRVIGHSTSSRCGVDDLRCILGGARAAPTGTAPSSRGPSRSPPSFACSRPTTTPNISMDI